jgi:hypothetical protein
MVVNVVAGSGPYVEQVMFDSIVGGSAINTLTILGNGNMLTFGNSTSGQRATLTFNNTEHVFLKNLEVVGTANTNSCGIELRNGASYINIDSCFIQVSNYSTSNTVYAITTGQVSVAPLYKIKPFNNNTITNCTIQGGYYGIGLNGMFSPYYCENNIISHNVIKDFYVNATYARGQIGSQFLYNDISRGNRTNPVSFIGMRFLGGMIGVRVEGNRIHNIADMNPNSIHPVMCIELDECYGTAIAPFVIANNLIYNINQNGDNYGIYVNGGGSDYIQLYHNTISLDNANPSANAAVRNIQVSTSAGNFDIRNNILSYNTAGSGIKHAIYLMFSTPNFIVDNNHYYCVGGGFANNNRLGFYNGSSAIDLAAWQALANGAFGQNSVYGNPNFTNAAMGNLAPLAPWGSNAGTNLLAIVPLDAAGATRDTVPDIGALEFVPITADLMLHAGFIQRSKCLSSNDTVVFAVENVFGAAIDLSQNHLSLNWTCTGPVNSSGTILANSGIFNAGDTLYVSSNDLNLSKAGSYVISSNISPSSVNQLAINDSITMNATQIYADLEAMPPSAIVVANLDSVEISAHSVFLAEDNFRITEVCYSSTHPTGQPVSGWPSYLLADDYMEVTGNPNADLAGYTVEQWDFLGLASTFTFAPGTLLSPDGTCILAIGSIYNTPQSPSNYYYHAAVGIAHQHSSTNGIILRNPQGAIVDAVGTGYSYVFPAAAGVSAAEWTGWFWGSGAGSRLNGPDINSSANWVQTGVSVFQDPNVLNPNFPAPKYQGWNGFTWSLNGNVIDSLINITVGPWATPGTYNYVATYTNSPCGILRDTVQIDVVACGGVTNVGTANTRCTKSTLFWQSAPNSLSTKLEWGAAGFTPGTGTVLTNPVSPITFYGLAPGTQYDVYLTDSCAAGLATPYLRTLNTATGPYPNPIATTTIVVDTTEARVLFNANASTACDSLFWDFDDGTFGSGKTPTHTYAANGTYNVLLIGFNDCGIDTTIILVAINGIDVPELVFKAALHIFPNPNDGDFTINLRVENIGAVRYSVVNQLGQTVTSGQLDFADNGYSKTIRLKSQAPGMYFVKLESAKGVISKKVVVQH